MTAAIGCGKTTSVFVFDFDFDFDPCFGGFGTGWPPLDYLRAHRPRASRVIVIVDSKTNRNRIRILLARNAP